MVVVEIILKVKSENVDRVRNTLLSDDVVSRANVLVRDAKSLIGGEGFEGYYVRIIGTDEQCNRASELVKDIVEEVKGEEKERISAKFEEEGEAAVEGFGRIFG
ncbi:MAG: hypothetical protein LZ163_02435 [Thaumarchaeota archaeon]|nr:hypothetical protein [Candidatus Terraquivivens yellowstonensis]MCL7397478.1 hypothetical protein [Candidatus Terraquivivens yellowstonensis]MCL7400410.1 hypothetical protein [Candidatus Terraquivivens yellowstonensis]